MLAADFQFDLPPELIAQQPPAQRPAARMLVLDRDGGRVTHRRFTDLPDHVRPGDLVVLNDTRVFPARLRGHWQDTAGQVELLLLEPLPGGAWLCLCGSGRRLRPGLAAQFGQGGLAATVEEVPAPGRAVVRFSSALPFDDVLAAHGEVPLPPYIGRPAGSSLHALDRERYQTVYARETGAVAAPTAGLHFTPEVLQRLQAAGASIAYVTLHVGPGTFTPVKAESVEDHVMEDERYRVPEETAAAIRACRAGGGAILAVGSTTVRTLETMAAEHDGQAVACAGRTRLFIRPPYRFRLTDRMLTNFHLPRSTLLMMVAALAGRERVLEAYREAVRERYRFYSYGDCMLIT